MKFAALFLAVFIVALLVMLASVRGEIIRNGVVRDSVDCIEVSSVYDENGNLNFTQLIFWTFKPEYSAYVVRAWRIVKSPSQLPQKDWKNGGYSVVWEDADIIRHVRATEFRETFLQHDPETADREVWPKELRRELTSGRLGRVLR